MTLRRPALPWPVLCALPILGACSGAVIDNPSGPATPAPPARLQRLTTSQYRAAVRDLLGPTVKASADLPADTPLHGYVSVGARETTIAPRDLELYEAAALDATGQVFGDGAARKALVGCEPRDAADPCLADYLFRVAARAYRRPLRDDERADHAALLATLAGGLKDPFAVARYATAAVLQAPDFLFRVELGEFDPNTPGRRRFSSYEMASRLSFLLTGGPPDDALREAAARGALTEDGPLAAEAQRLLGLPAARTAIAAFFAEHLNLARLDSVSKDQKLFPQFTPALVGAMKIEVQRTVSDLVFEQQGDLRDLWRAPRTFVNAELARLYGLPPPDKPGPDGFAAVALPKESRRGGLLGTAALLALNANATVTSPTHRGKFIRAELLCQEIPPPPPGVMTSLDPPSGEATTLRQRLTKHRESPACRGCHSRMDPIGLGLENFDAIGAFREKEGNLPIDPTGDLDGQAFAGAGELGALVAAQPDLGPCFVRQVFRHATGATEGDAQELLLKDLGAALEAGGHRLQPLLLALILSEGFRTAGNEVVP